MSPKWRHFVLQWRQGILARNKMKVDGKAIANDILDQVRTDIETLGRTPCLTAFTCEPNFETELFLKRKCKVADLVGARVRVIEFDREAFLEEIIMSVNHAVAESDGMIVQLPFPARIDINEVLTVIPPDRDVDALTYDGEDDTVLPPVVGAIKAILERHQINLAGKKVVVLGQGRLVGIPSSIWAKKQGAKVTVIDKGSSLQSSPLQEADVVITGAGKPGLITPDLVKPGVVILDAGTSEDCGVLKGDVDPAVEAEASVFTPVPGGIGPITVAVLLQNLVQLAARRKLNSLSK